MKLGNQSNAWMFIVGFMGIVLFEQCRPTGKISNTNVQTVKRESASTNFESIQLKEVKGLEQANGLWYGRFGAEPEQLNALQFYNSIKIDMDDFDGSEQEYTRMKYEKLPANYKKWFFKDPLHGDYVMRLPNAISIIIDKIIGDSVFGRSVCAGNERPLKGKAGENEHNQLALHLSEPGTDPYDGNFDLVLDSNASELFGTWRPFNKQLATKDIILKSAVFSYVPNSADWEMDVEFLNKNISMVELIPEDIENQSRQRLRLLRNLIYARHGYSFKSKDIREYFDGYDGYVPISTDVRKELTAVELKNMALMKRYEDYAEDYYDEFGR